MKYIWAYFFTALVFLPIDLFWLGVVARDFYFRHFGDLLAQPFNMPAAVGFYLTYIVGIVIFALGPAIRERSLSAAIIYGALFGFFCYATYDMTNLATLRDYPAIIVPVDILWGTVLTAASAGGGYWLFSRFATKLGQ